MEIENIIKRLFSRTQIDDESGCWVWQGAKTKNGYGVIGYKDGNILTHRMSYTLLVDNIPSSLQIDHLCRNRACINPTHLDIVTCKENLRRSPITLQGIQLARTHCPQGHRLEEGNLDNWSRRMGKRKCRLCRNKRDILAYHRKKMMEQIYG
jgi:hypothetical protein